MVLRLQEVELLLDPLDRLDNVELEVRRRSSSGLSGGAGWAAAAAAGNLMAKQQTISKDINIKDFL